MRIDGLTPMQCRVRCEEDPYYFGEVVLGFKFYEPLHGPMFEFLKGVETEDKMYSTVTIPRGHYKTTIFVMTGIPWWLIRNPNLRVLFSHANKQKGAAYLGEMRRKFEAPSLLSAIAPDVCWGSEKDARRDSPMWHRDGFTVRRSWDDKVPSVALGAPDAGVNGFHFHRHVYDDLVDEINYKTKTQREAVKDWLRAQVATLRNHPQHDDVGPRCVAIYTPWHPDDANQLIRSEFAEFTRSFECGIFGECGVDKGNDGKVIFPEQWPPDRIKVTRIAMGKLWASQYLCDPNPKHDRTFQVEDIQWYNGVLPRDRSYSVYTAIDPNRTIATKGDFGVVMTAAVDHLGHIWVLDMARGHPKTPELIKWIMAHVAKYKPRSVLVENTSYQNQIAISLRDEMEAADLRTTVIPVKRSVANRKDDRLEGLAPLVKSKMLHLPHGIGEPIRQELEEWPGKHDDTLDPLADILHHGRRPRPPSAQEPEGKPKPGITQPVTHFPWLEPGPAHRTATLAPPSAAVARLTG